MIVQSTYIFARLKRFAPLDPWEAKGPRLSRHERVEGGMFFAAHDTSDWTPIRRPAAAVPEARRLDRGGGGGGGGRVEAALQLDGGAAAPEAPGQLPAGEPAQDRREEEGEDRPEVGWGARRTRRIRRRGLPANPVRPDARQKWQEPWNRSVRF